MTIEIPDEKAELYNNFRKCRDDIFDYLFTQEEISIKAMCVIIETIEFQVLRYHVEDDCVLKPENSLESLQDPRFDYRKYYKIYLELTKIISNADISTTEIMSILFDIETNWLKEIIAKELGLTGNCEITMRMERAPFEFI